MYDTNGYTSWFVLQDRMEFGMMWEMCTAREAVYHMASGMAIKIGTCFAF